MTVLLVGCGRMGGALARGWAGKEILAYDPAAEAFPTGVRRITSLDPVFLPKDLTVFLAVKPQIFKDVAPLVAPIIARGALVVSIMAGTPIAMLIEHFGGASRLVRAMPNTPAAIGRGITAAFACAGVSAADLHAVETLLRAGGEVVWLDVESDLDAVTAISGSGPAYFFRFVEALARAGECAGLAPTLSMRLARATFTGAAALADTREETLATLRIEVTSPSGTTAAGLARLDDDDALDSLVTDVVVAATERSRFLSR